MKALFRILVVSAIIALIGFTFFNSVRESEPLEGPNANSNVIPKTELEQPIKGDVTRPGKGLSTYIGKNTSELLHEFGEPNRIEPSSFGYDWWVYNKDVEKYMMIGVSGEKITQIYIGGKALDATPYQIGESRDEIYRTTLIDYEVPVTVDENIYIFSMSEKDLQNRILVNFDGLFAQLYIDSETGFLQGIRYTDGATLVMHQPYEMSYQGDLIAPSIPSSFLQQAINDANAAQLDDLVNIARVNHHLEKLETDPVLSDIAKQHSEDMKIQNFLSHESPTKGDLKKRLHTAEIDFANANENLATAYFDAIEVMHGWLNSTEHRKIILDDKYTMIGSGVYLNTYTQVFIEPESKKETETETETDNMSEEEKENNTTNNKQS